MADGYKLAVDKLWQADREFLHDYDRYVNQLDQFHEELLTPILVDKIKKKSSREELAQVEYGQRIEMLASFSKEKNNLLGAFIVSVQHCRSLRRNPETHPRLHRVLIETPHVTWRERDYLKKNLIAGYQELTNWLIMGCPY